MKKVIGIAFLIIGLAAMIAGRIETFHLTEGEAFVSGWPYWLAVVIAALTAWRLAKSA